MRSSLNVDDRQPSDYEEVPDLSDYDEDQDQPPLAPEPCDDKTTWSQSFLHLVKGYIGPGCLSLPWAFSRLGVLPAVVSCFALCFWSSWNCWSIVRLKGQLNQRAIHLIDEEASRNGATLVTTYADVAGRLVGDRMRSFTRACICVQQLAICTVFLSFVGTNLEAVLTSVVGWNVSRVTVLTLALPAILALSCVPSLKALSPVTAFGTGLLFLGFGFIAAVVVLEWPYRGEYRHNDPSIDWKDVPLALCAILYSFEGICLILPVETSMLRPERFLGVFVSAMISSASTFSLLGGLSVATFGNVTSGSITAFLLSKYTSSARVRGLLLAANASVSLSVLVTYPLQLFPCLELLLTKPTDNSTACARLEGNRRIIAQLEGSSSIRSSQECSTPTQPPVFRPPTSVFELQRTSLSDTPQDSYHDDALHEATSWEAGGDDVASTCWTRIGLVMLTYVVAVAVPNVQSLISLAGALAGSSTALLIPPALELAWVYQSGARHIGEALEATSINTATTNPWKVGRCYVLLIGGFIFMVIGTVASIADIFEAYTSVS